MLHYCRPEILPYVTHVINERLITNIFLSVWKRGVVTLVPKTSNPREYNSKLREKIMNDQLRQYVTPNKIVSEFQSGFQPRLTISCTTALFDTIDSLIGELDTGKSSILVLLDYSKAFESVNHLLLINNPKYIGLSSLASTLIQSCF